MPDTIESLRNDLTELQKRVEALEGKSQPKKLDFSRIEGHMEHEYAPQGNPKLDFSSIPGHIEHPR